jgi:hypothetical protein
MVAVGNNSKQLYVVDVELRQYVAYKNIDNAFDQASALATECNQRGMQIGGAWEAVDTVGQPSRKRFWYAENPPGAAWDWMIRPRYVELNCSRRFIEQAVLSLWSSTERRFETPDLIYERAVHAWLFIEENMGPAGISESEWCGITDYHEEVSTVLHDPFFC